MFPSSKALAQVKVRHPYERGEEGKYGENNQQRHTLLHPCSW